MVLFVRTLDHVYQKGGGHSTVIKFLLNELANRLITIHSFPPSAWPPKIAKQPAPVDRCSALLGGALLYGYCPNFQETPSPMLKFWICCCFPKSSPNQIENLHSQTPIDPVSPALGLLIRCGNDDTMIFSTLKWSYAKHRVTIDDYHRVRVSSSGFYHSFQIRRSVRNMSSANCTNDRFEQCYDNELIMFQNI